MMMAMVLIFTVGCKKEKSSNNETTDYSKQVIGKWYYGSEDYTNSTILMLNEDKSMLIMGTNESGVYQYQGTYSVDKENLTLTGANGESRTIRYELSGENLILHHENNSHSYIKLIEDLNLIGKWNVSNVHSNIVPLKDELLLPPGMCDGQEIPESIPTASITGQFIEYAVNQYLKNIEFTDTHIKYDAISGEETVNLSKEYSLNSLNMTVKGNVAGLDVDVYLFAIQEKDKNQTILVLNKQTFSTMILGFAELLMDSGIGSEVEPQVLEEFKQNFMDTFANFAAIIYMDRQ